AETLRRRGIVEELAGRLAKPDEKIDLLRCALLVAKLDNDEVDVDAYLDEVERMAGEIRDGLPKAATVDGKLAALNRYLYAERGFHGSRRDYYSRSNSYLNEVIDDREGLPITLAVLYIEIGRRLGLDLRGVGMPGHFLAAVVKDGGERQLLDPFEQGAKLAEADAVQRAVETTGRAPRPEHLEPVGKQAIVVRLIENLLGLATDEDHRPRMQGYLDVILKVDPQNLERRMLRAMVHYRNGSFDDALADVDYLLDHHRDSLDEERVLEFRDRLERARREE
ncbi:MAG: transglutaminase family protein, partial [Planctomycetaceae bacterium]|nr:transglutaminase family protein [Planctomycetaceae bacterium]